MMNPGRGGSRWGETPKSYQGVDTDRPLCLQFGTSTPFNLPRLLILSVMLSVSRSVSLLVSQPASQLVSQPVSQLVSH